MADNKWDSAREEISEVVGEEVLWPWQIQAIVRRAGREYELQTIQSHLGKDEFEGGRVVVGGIEKVAQKYSIDCNMVVYKVSIVEAYLEWLQEKGRIDLHGKTIDELLKSGLPVGRMNKPISIYPEGNYPSFEGAIRHMEE